MNIERQKTPSVISIPEKKLFDVCLELNKLVFPFSHRDENSLFFVRPDMMIRRQDFEVILGDDQRQYSRWFSEENKKKGESKIPQRLIDEVIFKPSYEDLFKETHGIVNQLTKTLTAGWFAYTGIRPIPPEGVKSEDLLPDFIKGNGATPWFALADAWIQVQKWKTQK